MVTLLAAGRLNFSREWFAVGRVLGHSMNMRAEIQYALAQTRWLAMEGDRGRDVAGLCTDAVFIARKLGFDTVRIRLEDGERRWQVTPAGTGQCRLFRHPLPGHRYCFIELGVVQLEAGMDEAKTQPPYTPAKSGTSPQRNGDGTPPAAGAKEFDILGELLAEGWAKAIAAWEKQNQSSVRFDGLGTPASEIQTKEVSGAQPETI